MPVECCNRVIRDIYYVQNILMLTNAIKEKPVLISTVIAVLVLGVSGAAYYSYHQGYLGGRTACAEEVDSSLLKRAAGLIHTDEHKQLNTIKGKFQQQCPEGYTRSPDYHYIALRYYIIVNDHTRARKHLDRLMSLSRENMMLDDYNRTYSNTKLEGTISFLEKAAQDSPENDDVDEFTKEPGL